MKTIILDPNYIKLAKKQFMTIALTNLNQKITFESDFCLTRNQLQHIASLTVKEGN